LNKNSRLFTQVVLDALRSGDVQPTQASFLLGVYSCDVDPPFLHVDPPEKLIDFPIITLAFFITQL